MGRVIQLLVVAMAIYFGYRVVRQLFAPSKPKFQCATCRNCRTLYDDGVICMFGRRETFKNEMHIANCGDWERIG